MRSVLFATGVIVAGCGSPSAPAPAPTAPAAPAADVAAAQSKNEPCEDDYRPAPAPAPSTKVDLPPVPELVALPEKNGDAFTVFGATHALRSRHQSTEVTKGEISVVGWIVDSNVPRAPRCAWHKTGVADPEGCVTEIPAFVVADTKDTKPDDPKKPHIKVLGWARNFAAVYDATARYKNAGSRPKDLYRDEVWGVDVPFPIPAVGTKVKVKGRYGFMFTKSSSGVVTDPKNGVLTYSSLEVVP